MNQTGYCRSTIGIALLSLFVQSNASAEILDVSFSGTLLGPMFLSTGGPLTKVENATGRYLLETEAPDNDPWPGAHQPGFGSWALDPGSGVPLAERRSAHGTED